MIPLGVSVLILICILIIRMSVRVLPEEKEKDYYFDKNIKR
jgi:hypothetical protein